MEMSVLKDESYQEVRETLVTWKNNDEGISVVSVSSFQLFWLCMVVPLFFITSSS